MKLAFILIAFFAVALIAGCTQQPAPATVENITVINETPTPTPVVVSDIAIYANTSMIDQGILELNQVE